MCTALHDADDLLSASVGHQPVQEQNFGRPRRELIKHDVRFRGDRDFMAQVYQHLAEAFGNLGIIVSNENAQDGASSDHRRVKEGQGASMLGSTSVKVVSPPGALFTVMVPPMPRARLRQTASPMPCPCG